MIALLRRFLKLVSARDRWEIGRMIFWVVLGAGLEMAGVAILPLFVADLGDTGYASRKIAAVLHRPQILGWNPSHLLLGITLFTGGFYILKNLFGVWLVYRQSTMKIELMGQLGQRLLTGYLNAPYAWHLTHGTAAIQHNLQHEILGLFQRLINPLLTLTAEGAVVILIGGLLMAVSPLTTMIILILVLATVTFYLRFFRARLMQMGRQLVGRRTDLYRCLQNGLGGIKELKVLGRVGYFERQYAELMDGVARAEEFNTVVGYNVKPLMETLAVTALCLLVAFFVFLEHNTRMVLPGLALFAIAAIRLIPSANRIFLALASLRFGRVGALQVLADLEEVGIFTASSAVSFPLSEPAWKFNHEIQITHLFHRYDHAEHDSLLDISLTIRKGESIAFIGESGAGKTTLIDLILGLLHPTRGSIRVDGRDIHDFLPDWQRHLGYIPQGIHLAEESLRFNVAFGLPAEEIDDAQIWAALEAAQLADLVHSWPKKLDRLIGERGVRLSGGQRQRIGIARALYHDPAILVLDEATAALDNETEREIASVLESFRGRKTLLTIAHRLTTVQQCDTLFMLRRGRMIAKGSFEQLQRSSPDFQRMMQAAVRANPARVDYSWPAMGCGI